MRFAWPYVLLLLLVPGLLLLRNLFRRSRGAQGQGRSRILAATADGNSLQLSQAPSAGPRRRSLRLWTFLAALFSIIALARPQWGVIEDPVFEQSREILIGLDLSRSMQSDDIKPTRLARAKLLVQSLLKRLQGERVGLVVFSGTAFLQSPLSTDYEILEELLPDLGPDFLPEGGTAYRALLRTSLDAFSTTSNADRFLIILSDGEALDDDWKPLIASLKERKVRVISLGVGTAQGTMIPDGSGGLVKDERGAAVLSRLEPATLQELASSTGGLYRDASTWIDIAALIKETVETGQQGAFVEKRSIRHEERYQWPLAVALACALAALVLEFPARIRPRHLGRPVRTAATTTALAFLCACLPWRQLRAEEAPQEPALIGTVRSLSARDRLAETDCARLANETLAWGKALKEAGQPIPPGAVRDGIDAVNLGASLNPKAADWPTLRKNLEALLSAKDKPKQKQEDKQEQKQEQKPQEKEQEKQQNSQDKNEQQQQQQQQQQEPKQENSQQSQQKAFDKMEQPPQQPQQQEMQSVGGPDEKKPLDPQDSSMLIPLERLKKVKEQDSPARLFEMMDKEDKDRKPAPAKGPKKNW
jgi:Ca-activated chloride channel family protein